MELSYDLVFVVAVAPLAHELAANVTWDSLLGFVLLTALLLLLAAPIVHGLFTRIRARTGLASGLSADM